MKERLETVTAVDHEVETIVDHEVQTVVEAPILEDHKSIIMVHREVEENLIQVLVEDENFSTVGLELINEETLETIILLIY